MLDLFHTSFLATKKYILGDISNDINQLYYMSSAAGVLDRMYFCDDLEELIWDLLAYKQELEKKPNSHSFFHNRKKYEVLAVQHALDICYSLQNRFKE